VEGQMRVRYQDLENIHPRDRVFDPERHSWYTVERKSMWFDGSAVFTAADVVITCMANSKLYWAPGHDGFNPPAPPVHPITYDEVWRIRWH
jgi:hypothetical protein